MSSVMVQYQAELARMLALKRTNMSAFIQRERETMTELWDRLYTSYPQRLVEFPAYSISVEPTKVWNTAHGCDELVVSDNVSEELLAAHERERERLEKQVEDAGPMLDRLARYFAIVDLKKQLEVGSFPVSRMLATLRRSRAKCEFLPPSSAGRRRRPEPFDRQESGSGSTIGARGQGSGARGPRKAQGASIMRFAYS